MASAVSQDSQTTPARRPDERAPADARKGADEDRPVASARPGAAARGASVANAVVLTLSRAVRVITWLVVLIIVAGIALRVLDANTSNAIVHDIHTAAKTLVGPFSDVFKVRNQKIELAVNWGLAAFVYLIVGSLLASVIAKAAPAKPR